MGSDAQFIELIKHLTDIIKDLNGTFSSLSQLINTLAANVENLPRMHDIEARLDLLQQALLLKGENRLSELAEGAQLQDLQDSIAALMHELSLKMSKVEDAYVLFAKMNDSSLSRDILDAEIKRESISLQKLEVKELNASLREKWKKRVTIVEKVLAFLITVGSGLWAVFQFVIPFLTKVLENHAK